MARNRKGGGHKLPGRHDVMAWVPFMGIWFTFWDHAGIHEGCQAEVGHHKEGDDSLAEWYEEGDVLIVPHAPRKRHTRNEMIGFEDGGSILTKLTGNRRRGPL